MPYNFVADSFHTKKLCSRLSASKVRFYTENGVFECIGATYDDHLRFIGKCVVDFLLVLIELFFARCYSWVATSEYRFRISDFVPLRPVDPKFQLEWVPPNHSFFQKTRLHDLLYGIKIWTDFSSVLSQFTHLMDRQIDRQTPFSWLDHPACIAVVKALYLHYRKVGFR